MSRAERGRVQVSRERRDASGEGAPNRIDPHQSIKGEFVELEPWRVWVFLVVFVFVLGFYAGLLVGGS